MRSSRELIVTVASFVAAVAVANVLADAFHLATFRGIGHAAVAIACSATLAAISATIEARWRRGGRTRDAASIGAITAATVAFLIVRFPSPWIDLGPFGAGPLGELGLVVLPVAHVAGVTAARKWSRG